MIIRYRVQEGLRAISMHDTREEAEKEAARLHALNEYYDFQVQEVLIGL